MVNIKKIFRKDTILMSKQDIVKNVFRRMAEHTQPVCESGCRVPQSCCSPEYCLMAIEIASENWGIDLEPLRTDHPTLPFMGSKGCVIEPHFRPDCTLHVCCINSMALRPGYPKWTKKYFKLWDEINELME